MSGVKRTVRTKHHFALPLQAPDERHCLMRLSFSMRCSQIVRPEVKEGQAVLGLAQMLLDCPSHMLQNRYSPGHSITHHLGLV